MPNNEEMGLVWYCRIILPIFIIFLCSIGSVNAFEQFENSLTVEGRLPRGVYIGAYLGGGPEDMSSITITEFNRKMRKAHAIFVQYVDIKTSADTSHMIWATEVKRNGAMPMFIYDPYDGLDKINIEDITTFASKCKNLRTKVFIVFGHEMNAPWYPWGNKPEPYKEKFKEIAEIFHKTSPNVRMVWVPTQSWGYPWGGVDYGDGYSEYYPEGSGLYGPYVDWVGLNFYERDWDEDDRVPPDMVIANIRRGGTDGTADFYQLFSVEKGKPMLISETAAFDPHQDMLSQEQAMKAESIGGISTQLIQDWQRNFKNDWIGQLYNIQLLRNDFPNIHAICYFHVLKKESISTRTHVYPAINADYRIPDNSIYRRLIKNPYFIGGKGPVRIGML